MRVFLMFIVIIPILSWAGDDTGITDSPARVSYYFGEFAGAADQIVSTAEFEEFVGKLQVRKSSAKDSQAFIEYLFVKTHRKFLRSYTDYVSFGKTIETGLYNCLTGTALYALLLDRLGIGYKIIETNYHIFLLASTEKGQVLLEATDPQNGCVTNQEQIKERIGRYKQNEIANRDNGKRYFEYQSALYREVSLDQMTGLLHYNQAIVSYNSKDLPAAVEQLRKAIDHYDSPRIMEFSRLLLLTVVDSELEEHLKERCIKEIQSIRTTTGGLTARVGR